MYPFNFASKLLKKFEIYLFLKNKLKKKKGIKGKFIL